MVQFSNLKIETAVANRSEALKLRNNFKNRASLKIQSRSMFIIIVLMFMGSHIYGQKDQQAYFGIGMGLDYGGIFGGKIEYLPAKNFGLYGGLGYNLLSIGWNVGATYKILPDSKVSPNLMVFYGYNGVSKVEGAPEYEMTSYGVTIGGNLDIKVGSNGNKFSVGVFVPFRSQKFKDNYEEMKNDPRLEMKNELMPFAISVGYNFTF